MGEWSFTERVGYTGIGVFKNNFLNFFRLVVEDCQKPPKIWCFKRTMMTKSVDVDQVSLFLIQV